MGFLKTKKQSVVLSVNQRHFTDIMARKKRKTEEFEVKHDYIPDFLEALGELADLCEKEGIRGSSDKNQRRAFYCATTFRRAVIALDGQIITAVEDIKLFKLIELKGVGKVTLELFKEFIKSGKIERLEEMRLKKALKPNLSNSSTYAKKAKFLMDMFGGMTEHECEAMYNDWSIFGRNTYDPDVEQA